MKDFREAGLIDRIQIKLDLFEKAKLNKWIDDQKSAISNDRTNFLSRQKKYLSQYDDFISTGRKGQWEGSANYRMPLTLIMVNSYVARLYNILTASDMTSFSPREGTDQKFVDPLKRLRDWYLWDYLNNYRGIKGVAYEICQDVAKVGFALAMKSWELKQRKTIELEHNELAREMDDIDPQVEEMANQLAPGQIPEKRVDTKPYKEVEKILTVFEGTKIFTVPFENTYFPNDIPESSNMDHPECVVVLDEMTLSDIMLKVKQGEFDEMVSDQVEKLPPGKAAATDGSDLKQKREELTGVSSTSTDAVSGKRTIEHCFCTYDIDNDGIAEEIVVTRTREGHILRVTYLDRISKSGHRPLFKFDCFSKERQAYSRGVVEYMYPLQEEMDMNHNMRQDYLQLQTCPFFAYRSSSPLDKNKVRIAPGKGIPVDDVNTDIKMLTFQTNAYPLFQEESYLWQLGDRVARNSPLGQGQMPQTVGAQRSTSGVVTLLRQMDLEFKPLVEQFANNWKKLEKSILEDLDFRVDPALKARVLGPTVEQLFDGKSDFNSIFRVCAMLDMKIDVASIVNSDEMKRSDASLLLQMVSAPSLAQQMGIIGPQGIYNAWANWLKQHGFDVDLFAKKPEGIVDPLTLWQEIQIIYQGQMPPMSMQDDHARKAEDLQAFMENPEYQIAKSKGFTVANVDDMMSAAIQKHQALAQALAPAGMPNITGAQNQNQNQLMSANAPQQGGRNFQNTSSRDIGGASGEPEGIDGSGEAEAG